MYKDFIKKCYWVWRDTYQKELEASKKAVENAKKELLERLTIEHNQRIGEVAINCRGGGRGEVIEWLRLNFPLWNDKYEGKFEKFLKGSSHEK